MILERNLDLLKNIIANLQKSRTCKIQLAIAVNFTFSQDTDEEQVIHLKSYIIEVMTYDDSN